MTPRRDRPGRRRRPLPSMLWAWARRLAPGAAVLLTVLSFAVLSFAVLLLASAPYGVRAETPGAGAAGAQALVAAPAPGTGPATTAESWAALEAPGVVFRFALRDRTLAEWLWPYLLEDRRTLTEALRMFPAEPLLVVLAPTLAVFAELAVDQPPERTLGVYQLGRGLIVLRAPRTDPGGAWDPRGVLKHELVHALIDMEVRHPVPLWLHEGMAILLSGELSYLDEARLTWHAATDRMIPLAVLFDRFPRAHGSRELAYAQAASFVRFLLRRGGMSDLRTLLNSLASGMTLPGALAITYGEVTESLERSWQEELASRFSWLALLSSTTLLGLLGVPLVLAGAWRRRLQRRRKFAEWSESGGGTSPIAGPFPPNAAARPHRESPATPPPLNGGGQPPGGDADGAAPDPSKLN